MTWDAGLQPERAELAWRRTVLSVTAGTVIAARYLGQQNMVFGLVLPAVALCGGLVLLQVGTIRFRRINHLLRAPAPRSESGPDGPTPDTRDPQTSEPDPAAPDPEHDPVMPGAFMLATLSAMVLVIGLVSVAFILSTALRG